MEIELNKEQLEKLAELVAKQILLQLSKNEDKFIISKVKSEALSRHTIQQVSR